jgi:hypothetical protein
MARISDARASQFWDPNHLVSQQLTRMAKEKFLAEPGCCRNQGNQWDEVILYPPAAKWSGGSKPAFWNGPVVRALPDLEPMLRDSK